jgi:hypothetical protein
MVWDCLRLLDRSLSPTCISTPHKWIVWMYRRCIYLTKFIHYAHLIYYPSIARSPSWYTLCTTTGHFHASLDHPALTTVLTMQNCTMSSTMLLQHPPSHHTHSNSIIQLPISSHRTQINNNIRLNQTQHNPHNYTTIPSHTQWVSSATRTRPSPLLNPQS